MNIYSESTAVISDCKLYRYLLRRTWEENKIRALFVMLNPSTADASKDDATIRSCVRLCKDMGFGSLEVVNLFAWRATNPKELIEISDPVGDRNDAIIEAAISRCDLVILAWGANPLAIGRGRAINALVRQARPATFCFGATKNRQPKHPLYVKSGTPLVVYG
jgi:hypothetical protein